MPLTHLDDDYMIWRAFRRVTFWMADDKGFPVRCRVNNEALDDHAKRVRFEGTDVGKIFEAKIADHVLTKEIPIPGSVCRR